jgi:hydroxyacylglutathione hydrolase
MPTTQSLPSHSAVASDAASTAHPKGLHLLALPAFADNYIWMLHDGAQALVVDPGDAAPVISALERLGLTLAGILVTHHHGDHVGGVDALRPLLPDGGLHTVHAPAHEVTPTPHVNHVEGDRVTLLGIHFDVIDVPGHTRGHVAYFAAQPGAVHDHRVANEPTCSAAPLLFCGDTLFSGGCGRLFEGTPAQMHASLQKLAALPGDTRVCCTHEYTLSNLRFAAAVEPNSSAVVAYTAWCRAQRDALHPTLPSTLAQERLVNPFLRAHVPDVVRSGLSHQAISDQPADIFAALRAWKNTF